MLKRTRRLWLGGLAAWSLVMVVFAPAAEAQISGLFPLQNIKRKRTPCAMEDPAYKMYRHEFYGYHPTCWRKFPPNWGCPSPEAPDAKKSFEDRKLDIPKPMTDEEGGVAPGPDDGMRGGNRPNPNALPNLPSGGSPFDIEKPPAGGERGTMPEAPGTPPAREPRTPEAPTPPRGGGAGADAPAPSAPTPPGAADGSAPPNLTLPDPTAAPTPGTTTSTTTAEPNASGFQPAKRRGGLISQLLNSQLFRR
jgi:hypothetical protein